MKITSLSTKKGRKTEKVGVAEEYRK